MALSPAGLSSLPTSPPTAQWDPELALDTLLGVPDESVASVEFDFSLTTEETGGDIYNRGLSPPSLLSPASDVGSTQSVDSGILSSAGRFVAAEVGEEMENDRLFEGLFGEEFSELFSCENTSNSASLSLAVPSISPALSRKEADDHDPSHSRLDLVTSSSPPPPPPPPAGKNKRNTRFNSVDIDSDASPPPPPLNLPQLCVVPNSSKKIPSLSAQDRSRKNAEAARQNRLKKKKYIEELEKESSKLRAENVVLKTRCTEFQNKNKKLEAEVAYLHSVLANQSTLATLIKNIPGTPGVSLTSSFSRKRTMESSTTLSNLASLQPSAKKPKNNSKSAGQKHSGGVCLHVSKDAVSLEFCSQCSLDSAQV